MTEAHVTTQHHSIGAGGAAVTSIHAHKHSPAGGSTAPPGGMVSSGVAPLSLNASHGGAAPSANGITLSGSAANSPTANTSAPQSASNQSHSKDYKSAATIKKKSGSGGSGASTPASQKDAEREVQNGRVVAVRKQSDARAKEAKLAKIADACKTILEVSTSHRITTCT